MPRFIGHIEVFDILSKMVLSRFHYNLFNGFQAVQNTLIVGLSE